MKVLIVTPSYFPIVGGSEIMVRNFAAKLNKFGIKTDILTINMNKKWEPFWKEQIENGENYSVYKIPAINPFAFYSFNVVQSSLRLNFIPKPSFFKKYDEYDIIHYIGEADLTMPILSLNNKKPKIMHLVAVEPLKRQTSKHFIIKKYIQFLFKYIGDMYIISSPDEKKYLLDLNVPENKIMLLRFCVDTDLFLPNEKVRQDNLILFIGRINKNKGLHILLESLYYLEMKSDVVIIGPKEEPEYFNEITRLICLIKKKGVHNVQYLGEKRHSELLEWYQKATVLVRPDLLKVSGGLTALEALACGTPVIGTGNDVIKHRVNGIIIPPNNPLLLAEALYKILNDKSKRIEYGVEGRKIVNNLFSYNHTLKRMIKIYEKILYN